MLLLNLMHPTCERVVCDRAREALPLAGDSALGQFISPDETGLLKVILSWSEWRIWEWDFYIWLPGRALLKNQRLQLLPWLEGVKACETDGRNQL